MTNGNGTPTDLQGPLARMWRDVYAKAAGVAEGRTTELLKQHVYHYPHGAGGGGGGGGGGWSLVEKVTVATPTSRVTFAAVPTAGDCLMLISRSSVTEPTAGGNGAYFGLSFNGDAWPGTTDKYHYVMTDMAGVPGAAAEHNTTGDDRFAYLGYLGASLAGGVANDGGGVSICYLPDFRAAERLNAIADFQIYHTTRFAYGTARVVGGQYSTVYDGHGPLTALAVQCGNGQAGAPLQFDTGSTFALYVLNGTGGGGDGGGGGTTEVTITTDASLTATEAPANTFALAARLSPDAGNALSLHANGLYATDTGTGGGGTGNTTMHTQTGTPTGAENSLWFNPSESA